MSIYWLIFYILTVLWINFSSCEDGFIALWAPTRITSGHQLTTTLYSSNLPEELKISIKYRKTNSKLTLKNDEFKTLNLDNKDNIATLGTSLSLTVYKSIHKCSTKSLKILPELKNFYIFIQTNKPIYKPGDAVKFRILVINSSMKPFHMNNLKINIINPFDKIIKEFKNIEGQFLGIYENNFMLSNRTIIGDWKITAIVDNKEQFTTTKSFNVQKYILPFFNVFIKTDDKNYLFNDNIHFILYAEYSFGDLVTGNAELIIKNFKTNFEYFRKLFRNIDIVETFTVNIKDDLNINVQDVVTIDAILRFTEPESQLTFEKSTKFFIHNKLKYQVIPHHSMKFLVNTNFTVTVYVNEWNGEKLKSQNQNIELKFSFLTENFDNFGKIVFVTVIDGVAGYDIDVPVNAEVLHMEIKFIDSQNYVESDIYRARIEKGFGSDGIDLLDVDHFPKNPKQNDSIKISINSPFNLNKILTIITNKLGNIESNDINCNNTRKCEFIITISQDMLPSSTVTVYQVIDKTHIYQGSTTFGIDTFEVNDEKLNVEMSRISAEPKDKVMLNFTAPKNSKIYLMAIDKNLMFLNDGNDISKDDVLSAIGHHDGRNQLIIEDFSSWTSCTLEELDAVGVNDFGIFSMAAPPFEPEIRRNFPETWIFESFEMDSTNTAIKEFTAPDSITTWIFTAFSLNFDNSGLSFAAPLELKVMNQFFMRLDLPYSIKFMEVLRLDILIFNYIDAKDFLQVEVQLDNFNGQEFQFVEYSAPCSPTYSNKSSLSEVTSEIPYKSVRKVSFYIRSNPADNDFSGSAEKIIKLKITGTGRGRNGATFKDVIEKELLVEPVGVSDFIISNQDFMLNGSQPTNSHFQHVDATDLRSVNVIVGGDYMSGSMWLTSRFEFYPYDCLEQKTSKLKGNVEYFRYRLAKEDHPSTEHFSDYYQSLLEQRTRNWNYHSGVGFRAYFLEAVASAMEIGALPTQNSVIENELDYIKDRQQNSGNFLNFGNFPATELKYGAYAASYFETAYVLLPFLKFKGLVDKNYEDLIQKALNYLKSNKNRVELNFEGYPVAAYAFAINNDMINAQQLLADVEKLSVDYSNNKKCFKVCPDDNECQVRHTAYAALAYIQLNEISKALPIVNWLITAQNLNFFYSNTYEHALTTEPIAKLAEYLKTDQTSLKVMLNNKGHFEKVVEVNSENSATFQDIEFPINSQDVVTSVDGHGYCSITTIFERIILLPTVNPKFKLTVNPKSQNILKVCAEYAGNDAVMNVIYEVEMPSGYVYAEILDIEDQQSDIKLITERRKGTMIYIYYNDFRPGKSYCVDVKARKTFDVRDAKLAGVKVYDYSDKQNVAIEFYKFSEGRC